MRKVVSLAIITLAFVTGCAVNPHQPAPATQTAATAPAPASQPAPTVAAPAPVQPSAPAVQAATSDHEVCRKPHQKGCFDFVFASAKYDAKQLVLGNLPTNSNLSQDGRTNRATMAGQAVLKELMEGRAQPAQPTTGLLFAFKTRPVSAANLLARVVDNNKKVRNVVVEDVTGLIKSVPASASLGTPTAVYRIRMELAGSLIMPRTMFTADSHFLFCPEAPSVYPDTRRNQGLGVSAAEMARILAHDGVVLPNLSLN